LAVESLGKAGINKPPHLPGGGGRRCRGGAQATGAPTGAGTGGGAGRGNRIKFEGTSTVGGATGGGFRPSRPLAGSPRAAGPATAPQPTAPTPTGRGPKGGQGSWHGRSRRGGITEVHRQLQAGG
jgi:hypothetical protein